MLENNIIKYRKKKKLRVYQLAELAEVGVTTLRDIERGRNSPTIPTLYKISRALGITIDRLVFEEYKDDEILD